MNARTPLTRLLYDRALLLHGPKRNEILTLDEVRQYGTDSFSDVDYLSTKPRAVSTRLLAAAKLVSSTAGVVGGVTPARRPPVFMAKSAA